MGVLSEVLWSGCVHLWSVRGLVCSCGWNVHTLGLAVVGRGVFLWLECVDLC